LPIQNAKIEFAPPKRGDLDDINRAFQDLQSIISLIALKIKDPDQPAIKFIGDTTSQFQITFEQVIDYGAAGGSTVVLPLANSIAGRRSRQIYIMNTGPGTLTVSANGMDTVDGAQTITIATGTFKILRSNGNTKWLSK